MIAQHVVATTAVTSGECGSKSWYNNLFMSYIKVNKYLYIDIKTLKIQ